MIRTIALFGLSSLIFLSSLMKLSEGNVVEIIIDEKPNIVQEIKEENNDIPDTIVVTNEPEYEITEDILLIAWITMGEAEGEIEEGKRLVIDTILNRCDSSAFPDTFYEVIYQKNQFSCVSDGRLNRTKPTDEVCDLVIEELYSRTNDEVLFFTAGNYSAYGTPMFKVGNHYFSKGEGL